MPAGIPQFHNFRLAFSVLQYFRSGLISPMEIGRFLFFIFSRLFCLNPSFGILSNMCHLKSATVLGLNKLVKLSRKVCSCSMLRKWYNTCIIESIWAFVFNLIYLQNLAFLKKVVLPHGLVKMLEVSHRDGVWFLVSPGEMFFRFTDKKLKSNCTSTLFHHPGNNFINFERDQN